MGLPLASPGIASRRSSAFLHLAPGRDQCQTWCSAAMPPERQGRQLSASSRQQVRQSRHNARLLPLVCGLHALRQVEEAAGVKWCQPGGRRQACRCFCLSSCLAMDLHPRVVAGIAEWPLMAWSDDQELDCASCNCKDKSCLQQRHSPQQVRQLARRQRQLQLRRQRRRGLCPARHRGREPRPAQQRGLPAEQHPCSRPALTALWSVGSPRSSAQTCCARMPGTSHSRERPCRQEASSNRAIPPPKVNTALTCGAQKLPQDRRPRPWLPARSGGGPSARRQPSSPAPATQWWADHFRIRRGSSLSTATGGTPATLIRGTETLTPLPMFIIDIRTQ